MIQALCSLVRMALQAENVGRVSRRGFGEPCQAELLPIGCSSQVQGGCRGEDRAMRKMNQTTPKFWRLVPKFRGPRYSGPRSASRSRRGPRFSLIPAPSCGRESNVLSL
jgi:hypothetical protein